MGRRISIALCVLALAGPSWAGSLPDKPPHFEKGSPFQAARTALLKAGYSPVPQHHSKQALFCGADDDEPDLCAVYPEVIRCTATGIQYCRFAFERKSDHKKLVVTTYGEEVSRLMFFQTEWHTFD
jgi:hypothetical protein